PCESRAAADGEPPLATETPGHRRLHVRLGTVQLHRRQELTVRKLRQTLRLAADADELLDVRVPRGNVRGADPPVHADALLRVRLEVQVAPAVDLASPHDRAPAHVTAADP